MTGPVVVVGDALLDVDLVGSAGRLSPDAPAPVLDDLVEWPRPGGAGLAALMAARDGADVVLVTALAEDDAGDRVERLLGAAGVRVLRLPYDGQTPVKKRVRSSGQTLVRLDSGTRGGTVDTVPDAVAEVMRDARAVLVADYGRGVAAVPAIRHLLEQAARRVPVVWDPHPGGGAPVPGVKVVTPNAAEAAHFTSAEGPGQPVGSNRLAVVGRRADALVTRWAVQSVAVTMGEHGALLSYGGGAPAVVPAPAVHCIDPCGAGDRFSVTVTLALASGRVLTEAVQDGVRTAAEYVAAGGPAALTSAPRDHASAGSRTSAEEDVVESVRAHGGTVVATGGCFDLLHAGHVATLRAARDLGDCLVVCVNSDASVRRLKGPSRPLVPEEDRIKVLEALECVDTVAVFDEDTPVNVIRRLRPDVWAKGGDYAGAAVPEEEVLREWGGQVVALPYLQGRSTTRLVATAAARTDDEKETV